MLGLGERGSGTVGETPTGATETVALPEEGAEGSGLLKLSKQGRWLERIKKLHAVSPTSLWD